MWFLVLQENVGFVSNDQACPTLTGLPIAMFSTSDRLFCRHTDCKRICIQCHQQQARQEGLARTSRRVKDSAVDAESTMTGNGWPSSMISQRPGTTSTDSMPATIACRGAGQTVGFVIKGACSNTVIGELLCSDCHPSLSSGFESCFLCARAGHTSLEKGWRRSKTQCRQRSGYRVIAACWAGSTLPGAAAGKHRGSDHGLAG